MERDILCFNFSYVGLGSHSSHYALETRMMWDVCTTPLSNEDTAGIVLNLEVELVLSPPLVILEPVDKEINFKEGVFIPTLKWAKKKFPSLSHKALILSLQGSDESYRSFSGKQMYLCTNTQIICSGGILVLLEAIHRAGSIIPLIVILWGPDKILHVKTIQTCIRWSKVPSAKY